MNIKVVNEVKGQYQIAEGVSKSDLQKLATDPKTSCIQFARPLLKNEIDQLEKYVFSNRPDISLRVYGHYNEGCDLTFLERIPSLRKVSADCLMEATGIEVVTKLENLEELCVGIFSLDNFDFLENVNPNLKELSLYQTKSKKPKIDCIARFKGLEFLYLEGQQKGIESINELKKLQRIILRSVSTSDLKFLIGLSDLWSVDIKLGGIKDFSAIETLSGLKYLELWQIKGLNDLSFISKLTNLQNLYLQSLKQVKSLPDFSALENLRRIYLENLKGLENLSSLEFAPGLEEFIYVLAQNQNPQNLISILKNPNVKKVFCRFGSDKKNNEFDRLANENGKEQYKFSVFQYR